MFLAFIVVIVQVLGASEKLWIKVSLTSNLRRPAPNGVSRSGERPTLTRPARDYFPCSLCSPCSLPLNSTLAYLIWVCFKDPRTPSCTPSSMPREGEELLGSSGLMRHSIRSSMLACMARLGCVRRWRMFCRLELRLLGRLGRQGCCLSMRIWSWLVDVV